jgi:hypothetical protein
MEFLVFSFVVQVLMYTRNGGIGHNVFGFCPLCKVLSLPPPNASLSNFHSYAISQMPSLIREARLPGCLGERKSIVQHLS